MNKFNFKKDIRDKLEKDLSRHLRVVAIEGSENIKNELTKRKQEAKVTHTVKNNVIQFVVEPKTTKVDTKDIKNMYTKQITNIKDILGVIPVEMFSEQAGEKSISTVAVDKAMEKTQESLNNKFEKSIKEMY